ncbi:uncharacterized protein LOC143452087 [Clavelina lepadiformis]|uniref:uncharacterized protein LOC143452087 n=1 Tax=Clavelina lepadiformis TaxID=159417 RepID=UPI0040437566
MKLAAVALLLVFIGLTTALPKQVKDRNFEERRTQEWKQLKERIKKRNTTRLSKDLCDNDEDFKQLRVCRDQRRGIKCQESMAQPPSYKQQNADTDLNTVEMSDGAKRREKRSTNPCLGPVQSLFPYFAPNFFNGNIEEVYKIGPSFEDGFNEAILYHICAPLSSPLSCQETYMGIQALVYLNEPWVNDDVGMSVIAVPSGCAMTF